MENAQELLDNVRLAQQCINELELEKEAGRDELDKEVDKVSREYRDRIWGLEQEKRKAISQLEGKIDKYVAGMDTKLETHYSTIKHAQRVLAFLSLPTQYDLWLPDKLRVNNWAFQYQEDLGYFLDDELLKIRLYIIGNRKPKNRYSLVAIGRTVFSRELLSVPYSYGTDIMDSDFQLISNIRDGSSAEELIKYLSKSRASLLKPTIIEYVLVKHEYNDVITNYNIKDLAPLIVWFCPSCNNFYTVWEQPYRAGVEAPNCGNCRVEMVHREDLK